MSRKTIHTPKAPKAIGPYSQAVAAGGAVYCSGQIGLDPATGEIVKGGVEAEARRVFSNLAAVAEAAGASLAAAVRVTIYLADLGDFAKVNAIMQIIEKTAFIENVLAASMSPGMAASLDWSRGVQTRALTH